jgi:hypothetical protein
MRTAISIVALLLAASMAPTAVRAEASPQASSTAGAQAAREAARPPKEKLICRRYQASETRLRTVRVCLTADEWKAKDRRSS